MPMHRNPPQVAWRWMRHAIIALGAAAGVMALVPHPATATIAGPCTGTGYSSPRSALKPGQTTPNLADAKKAAGSTVDFKSQPVWHVPSWKDYMAGEGKADGAMRSGFAFVSAFGFRIPVAGGTGSGATGTGGPISAFDIASDKMPAPFNGEPPARFISAAGAADPDPKGKQPASGPCAGAILIEFMDANAASTVVGQVGIGLIIIGAAGVAAVSIRRA